MYRNLNAEFRNSCFRSASRCSFPCHSNATYHSQVLGLIYRRTFSVILLSRLLSDLLKYIWPGRLLNVMMMMMMMMIRFLFIPARLVTSGNCFRFYSDKQTWERTISVEPNGNEIFSKERTSVRQPPVEENPSTHWTRDL